MSNAISLQPVPEFNPDSGDVGASLATLWKKWLADFEMFTVAAGITDKTRKRALLLYQAGSRVRVIFGQLEATGEADDYDTAKKKLTEYFEPQKNRRYDVYCFRQAHQEPNETLDQYHTRLRTLAVPCEFGDNLAFELEEQIIIGGTSSRIRKQALRDPKYDLKAMLLDGRRDEISQFQSKEIESQKSERRAEETNQIVAAKSTQKCRNCGKASHQGTVCPAKGKECNKCGKLNHFARSCLSKATKTGENPKKRSNKHNKGNKNIRPLAHSDSESEGEYLYPVKTTEKRRPYTRVKVLGHSFSAMVDTGASINVIDKETFAKLPEIELENTKTRAFAYDTDKPVKFIGKFDAVIETRKRYAVATFYVVNNNTSGNLISADTAQELGLVTLHLNKISSRIKPSTPVTNDGKLNKVLEKHSAVFKGLGKLKDNAVKLNIDENFIPVAEPQRRIPFHIREKVKRAIENLEKDDIIEKVPGTQATPWISPIVAVPKKDDDVRICVDMRKPNQAIQRIRHLIPTVDDVNLKLTGATVFSKLDMSQAYHQLELHEDSRYITTFSTHIGLFRYKRLNYGTNAAAEIFQNALQTALEGIPGVCNIADDIIVFGVNRQEHDKALNDCLQRLSDKGLTLNASKCKFLSTSLSFFGQIFSATGTRPDPKHVQDLQDAQVPKNVHEVRSFLGMANYNCKYIPDYATISTPLRELTKKNAHFQWQAEHQQAFQKLKNAITSVPVMAYFDTKKDTVITVDASPVVISAILAQKKPNHDDCRIVAYASRALSPVEKRYSQTEKEALSIVWAVEHFHLFIYGKPFQLVTDHKPLEVIYGNPKSKPSARIERWVLRLQPYRFTVQYKPGVDNPADFLSRHPTKESASRQEKMTEQYINLLTRSAVPKTMTIAEIKNATDSDKTLQGLRAAIRLNRWDCDVVKPFKSVRDELTIGAHNLILRGTRIVIPKSLQKKAVDLAHATHQGLAKTKSLLREKVWFPDIDKMVKDTIDHCLPCQATGRPNPPEPLQMTDMPDGPWQKIHADFYGPLPSGEYLLVVIDRYSRYPEVEIVRSTKAASVIPKLDKMFATHGIPETMTSDNGPPFNGDDYQRYLTALGINKNPSTPKWPQGNAEVERFNQPLGKALKTATIEGKVWQQEINRFLLQYRTTPHSTTKVSPAELLFNRVVQGTLPSLKKNVVIDRHKEARENELSSQRYNKQYADGKRRAKASDLKVGDNVLVKQDRRNKLTPTFNETPYIVTDRTKSRVTAKNKHDHTVTRNVSHFKRIPKPTESDKDDISYETDSTVGNNKDINENETEEHQQPLRRSSRIVKEPQRFGSSLPSNFIRKLAAK